MDVENRKHTMYLHVVLCSYTCILKIFNHCFISFFLSASTLIECKIKYLFFLYFPFQVLHCAPPQTGAMFAAIPERRHEKTGFLPMRKQRRRSAMQ